MERDIRKANEELANQFSIFLEKVGIGDGAAIEFVRSSDIDIKRYYFYCLSLNSRLKAQWGQEITFHPMIKSC